MTGLAEADLSMTEMAIPDPQAGERPGDEKLAVGFFLEAMPDDKRSLEEGRPCYKDCEMIEIRIPGDALNIRVDYASAKYRNRFPRHYAAFKAKKEQSHNGTPLSELIIIGKAQQAELEHFGVHTVEQLAGMSDANAQSFRSINALRERARNWLEEAEKQAPLNRIQAEKEALEAKIAALTEQVEHLAARVPDEIEEEDE